MKESAKSTWFSVAALAAVTLVPLGLVGAVLVGARGPDPSDSFAAHVSTTQSPATPRASMPVFGQSPLDMTEQHHEMTDQMRASVSATMNELMNRDPMWQMMRSTALIADLEKHDQDIARMLGLGG